MGYLSVKKARERKRVGTETHPAVMMKCVPMKTARVR